MADHGHRNVEIVKCATCPSFLYPSDIAHREPTGEVYCLPCSLRGDAMRLSWWRRLRLYIWHQGFSLWWPTKEDFERGGR